MKENVFVKVWHLDRRTLKLYEQAALQTVR